MSFEGSDVLVLYVNGKRVEVANPSTQQTLVAFLRDDLGLRGSKVGCGEGGCGACTVTVSSVDRNNNNTVRHVAANACVTRLCSLHGMAVTTVEGLGNTRTELHPVQERIYKAHGSQCGFCTPGMVMSMSSLLRAKEAPAVEDVEVALQGNLCRCTGYRPILESFRTFCKDAPSLHTTCADTGDNSKFEVATFDAASFKPYTRDCDPSFPEELMKDKSLDATALKFKPSDGVGPIWFRPTTIEQLSKLITTELRDLSFEYFAGGLGKYKIPHYSRFDAVVQINAIPELRGVEVYSSWVMVASCTSITNLKTACVNVAASRPKEAAVFQAIAKAISVLASPQVRNMATVGGHIMWAHPCSDLLPVLMAAKCQVVVMAKDNTTRIVPLDETFFTSAFKTVLSPGDLITHLRIPFSKQGDVLLYYRRARRKEFDLPISNAAVGASLDSFGKLKNVRVIAGGMESAFPGARAAPHSLLRKTVDFMEGKVVKEVDLALLRERVFEDVFVEERSPGQMSNYRRCLIAAFIERFLTDFAETNYDISNRPTYMHTTTSSFAESHHLFEKVPSDQPPEDPVQRPTPHNWAAEQATGEAVYVGDMRTLADEHHLVLVTSAKANALVKEIDFSEALKVAGVIGVVTSKDIEGRNGFGLISPDEVVMASEEVLYHGQIMAGLVCKDLTAGRRARRLVKVTYEEREAKLSIRQIKNTDDSARLTIPHRAMKLDRSRKVEATGKTVTVKGTVNIGGQEHFYMEPVSVLAYPEGEKDEYVIFASVQNPTHIQSQAARMLGLPDHKITVRFKRIGGGFGGKERCQAGLIAVLAAKKFQKPIRITLTREEDMATTGQRHDLMVDYEVTADETGKITDTSFNINTNSGATSDITHAWTNVLTLRLDGGYTFESFRSEARNLKTNTVSNTAMRGFGGPEGTLVAEVVMEHLAHTLKIDGKKVREANLTRDGDRMCYTDLRLKGCTLGKCWEECLKLSKYDATRKAVDEFNAASRVVKRGLSLVPIKFFVSPLLKSMQQGGAFVRVYTDGSVLLNHGGCEMGQGLHTKMLQVASRALGIDMTLIHSHGTSTEFTANTTMTGGSISADIYGPAVIDACTQIKQRIEPFKRAKPDGAWKDWVEAAYLDKINLSAYGWYDSSTIDYDAETHTGVPFEYMTFGAGAVEVEVDCHTGDVTVLSADLVMDVGRSLNPAIDIGQIEGGFVQGLGYVTTEQMMMSGETGEMLTRDPGTYKIPTVADIPRRFNVTLLTHEEGRPTSAVYSSKGVGEPPLLLAMGVPIAVRQAVDSYRRDHGNQDWFHLDVPATVDKIRMACTDEFTKLAEKGGVRATNEMNNIAFEK